MRPTTTSLNSLFDIILQMQHRPSNTCCRVLRKAAEKIAAAVHQYLISISAASTLYTFF